MTLAAVKEKLHNYIDHADDKKVKAMFTLLENDIEQEYEFTDADLEELDRRGDNYLSGKSKSIPLKESKKNLDSYIAGKKKMHYNLEVGLEAELDIQNAIDYYFAINIDLAERFRDELYKSYEKITKNPQFYKYLSKRKERKYRRVQLKSFPYIVIYWVRDKTIVVISVFSTYRKPLYGKP